MKEFVVIGLAVLISFFIGFLCSRFLWKRKTLRSDAASALLNARIFLIMKNQLHVALDNNDLAKVRELEDSLTFFLKLNSTSWQHLKRELSEKEISRLEKVCSDGEISLIESYKLDSKPIPDNISMEDYLMESVNSEDRQV